MSRQGRLTLLVWLALLAIAVWQAARTPIRTDLSVFLPRSPALEQQILIEQLRAGALARLVLVGIEGGTAEQRAEASRARWPQRCAVMRSSRRLPTATASRCRPTVRSSSGSATC